MRTLLLLSSCLAVACVTIPRTGTPATGEALSVRTFQNTYEVTENVKVGEVTHRDSRGNVVGTSDVTQNRSRLVTDLQWRLYQGESTVDESDFYRIAGDLERSNNVDAQRQSANTLQTAGWVGVGVGVAAALTGLGVTYASLSGGEPSLAGYGLLAGGGVVGGLSYLVSSLGAARLREGVYLLTEREAQEAAARYNRHGAKANR